MRTRLSIIAASAVCLTAWAMPARSADYPYSGFFTQSPVERSLADAQAQCAVNFLVQETDGSYVAYHLDVPKFLFTEAIRYVEWNRGRCAIDASGKIERCTSTYDADPAEQGKTYTDVLTQLDADTLGVTYFDTAEAAAAHVQTGATNAGAVSLHFNRCLDFDAARMAGYITADKTSLSLEQLRTLTSGDPNQDTKDIMREVLEAIRLDKGK